MPSRTTAPETPPPCFARVIPGLEPIAAEEIAHVVKGEVKKTAPGLVVFRVPEVNTALLRLRTVEDVFLFGWGTDELTYRAQDLDRIQRWTDRDADWGRLLRIHHAITPKPRGKPSYRLVTQMMGKHCYRRVDARKAFADGLRGKIPGSWKHVEEGAAVEFWLTILGRTAICGLRISDRDMRHRTYKVAHLPASLRPTLAAAMVYLGGAGMGHTVVDPMCGAGTILAEQLEIGKGRVRVYGGDFEAEAIRAAATNLRRLGEPGLARWDARRLPLDELSVERIITNLPFGKQYEDPTTVGPLYRRVIPEFDRILRGEGRAVLLTPDLSLLADPVRKVGWKLLRRLPLKVLGQAAEVTVWRKA